MDKIISKIEFGLKIKEEIDEIDPIKKHYKKSWLINNALNIEGDQLRNEEQLAEEEIFYVNLTNKFLSDNSELIEKIK